MTVYLVDMENIPHAWGKLLDIRGEDDRFVLFYTEQVTQIPISLMVKAMESHAPMEFVKCHSGPNGLDFQLVTEMGYRIARDPSAEYVVVSQDHGYDVVIDYWSERGVQARRVVPSLIGQGGVFSEYGEEAEPLSFTSGQDMREFLIWKLSNKVPKGEIPFVVDLLMESMAQGEGYSTDRRLSCRFTYLDRALRERYGNDRGPRLRDQIKAVSRELFGLDLPEDPAGQAEELAEKPAQEPAPEAPDNSLRPQLVALGLSSSRAEETAAILTGVLQSPEVHPKAAVYRKMLSAFGREEGSALYRAVRDFTGQLLLERDGAPETGEAIPPS